MTDAITLRAVTSDEMLAFRDTFATVFGFPAGEGPMLDFLRGWVEIDRTIAAFDGPDLVATGGTLSHRLAVPGGGAIPAGGLCVVSVSPSHRRRGILSQLMRHHFDDVEARAEVVSILYSSESSIYGRYGYGVATESTSLSIARVHAALRADVAAPLGRFRVVVGDAERDAIEDVYARAVAGTSGALAHRPADWDRFFFDPPAWRDGGTPHRIAIYERDGLPCAYAKYRQKVAWNDEGPDATVVVSDIQAVDGEAYAATWRFLLSLDLAARVEASGRPVADPLVHLLADPRRLRRKQGDSLWLRLLDIPTALSERRYRVEGTLILEVEDAFLPATGGRFRLEGGPDGAECTPTEDDPDITLSTSDLASAYLGAPRLASLGWLGRVGGDAETIRLADHMFTTSIEPHCSVLF